MARKVKLSKDRADEILEQLVKFLEESSGEPLPQELYEEFAETFDKLLEPYI